MSLTIAELVANPSLATRVIAGSQGLERPVTWAHTCELPDPWNWLGTGDLLMTDGYSFPADSGEQMAFVESLARANISGLTLAEGFKAPPVTPEAVALANELAFPILETQYNVPFVSVARAVAESNSHATAARLTKTLRLYDVLRRTHISGSFDSILDTMATDLNLPLFVVESKTGRDIMPTSRDMPEAVRRNVTDFLVDGPSPMPAFGRVATDGGTALVFPLGRDDRAALIAIPASADGAPDLVLLQHVAMIAEMDVERRIALSIRRKARGARLLQQLTAGSITSEAAIPSLEAMGVADGPWIALCLAPPADRDGDDVEVAMADVSVPGHLYLRTGDDHIAFATADGAQTIADHLGANAAIVGLSQPFTALGRVTDAVRESRWALEAARTEPSRRSTYGEDAGVFLPRTVAEGQAVVDRVLGRLVEYDEQHNADLVRSLEVFFEANKSWQDGARTLGVHKQTLVYRMHKVEDLTGRNLRNFSDQAELFLALRTLRLLHLRD